MSGVNQSHLRSVCLQPLGGSDVNMSSTLSSALVNARSVVNKTFILHDFLLFHNLDILFITETWLTAGDLSPISEIVSSDYCYFSSPRTLGRGGGTAVVFKKHLTCR